MKHVIQTLMSLLKANWEDKVTFIESGYRDLPVIRFTVRTGLKLD